MSSHFGQVFRISTFGESHGGGVGVVIDGCPPRLPLSEADLQRDLDRRRPGQSDIVTPRKEADRCRILSGVFEGRTLGTPIAVLVPNEGRAPRGRIRKWKPPSGPATRILPTRRNTACATGRAGDVPARGETIGRVAAGAVAKVVLRALRPELEIVAFVRSIYQLEATVDPARVRLEEVEANPVRCPDAEAAAEMVTLIKSMRARGDSVGGVIECVVRGTPPGWG